MIKVFDTSAYNIFFKREYKLIKTGIEDIDRYLNSTQQKQISANGNGKVQGVIEIFGASGSGKTDLVLKALIESILPAQEPFNGNEVGVIYFDNDYKFDIIKLESLLKERYEQCKKIYSGNNSNNSNNNNNNNNSNNSNSNNNNNNSNNNNNNSFIDFDIFFKSCISRLYIYRCRDSFQFLITLKSINQFIRNINNNSNNSYNNNDNSNINNSTPKDINLIIIDSISAYYWIDRKGEGPYPNLMWIEVIKKIINDYSIIVLATKQAIFSTQQHQQSSTTTPQQDFKSTLDILGNEWSRLVKYRVILKSNK